MRTGFIRNWAPKAVVAIHDGSPYAQQLAAVMAKNFEALGGKVLSTEAVAPTDVDMHPVLTHIATEKPDAIYLPIFVAAAAQTRAPGADHSGPGEDPADRRRRTDGAGFHPGRGAAASSASALRIRTSRRIAMGKGYPAMVDEYKQMFGEAPISGYHANSYDAATMAVMAIKKVAVVATDGTTYIGRKALRDAVFATKFEGVGGPIGCDAYGECAQFKPAVYEYHQRRSSTFKIGVNPKRIYPCRMTRRPSSAVIAGPLPAPRNARMPRAPRFTAGRQGASMSAVVHARRRHVPSIARMNFVDIALWAMRILVLAVVIGGTAGTLIRSRYGITEWLDFLLFGVTMGSIYAQVALGYTMVYGVLRLINFAHGDIMMTGAFAGYFVANGANRSGLLASGPVPGDPADAAGVGRRLHHHCGVD